MMPQAESREEALLRKIREAAEKLNTPEGTEATRKALNEGEGVCRQLEEASVADPLTLNEPFNR